MKYWEFLIQKEGDQTWLPLETQQVEILEGRYRVVAHSDRTNTPVAIRVSQLMTDEMPPRQRVRQRTGQTNESGLVVVMPFAHLKPGQWTLKCSSVNALDDMLGDGWQHDVQLQVFARSEEDWSNEWPVPEDGQPVASVLAEDDSKASLPSANSPLRQAQAELQQKVDSQEAGQESSREANLPSNSVDELSAQTYSIALKQQAYLAQRDRPMTIVGKVRALSGAVREEAAGQLWIRLQNPETAAVIMEAHRPLRLVRLPADFKVQVQLPNDVKTRVVLGEVSLRTVAIDEERSAQVLASTAFTITAGIDQILDAIANQDSGTFEEEVSFLSSASTASGSAQVVEPSEPSAEPSAEPIVPSFDLGQKTIVPAVGVVLPPQLDRRLDAEPAPVLDEVASELPDRLPEPVEGSLVESKPVESKLIDLPMFAPSRLAASKTPSELDLPIPESVLDKPAVEANPTDSATPASVLPLMPPMVSAPAQFVGTSIEDSDLEADEIAAVLDDIDQDLRDEPSELETLEAPGIEGVVGAMPQSSDQLDSAAAIANRSGHRQTDEQSDRQATFFSEDRSDGRKIQPSRKSGKEVEANLAFQSLKLKDHFWQRLSTLTHKSHQEAAQLAANMDAAGVQRFSAGEGGDDFALSSLPPLEASYSNSEVVIYDEPNVVERANDSVSDRGSSDYRSSPTTSESYSKTSAVTSQSARQRSGQSSESNGLSISKSVNSSDEVLPEMALPVISLPMGDLVAGARVTVTVRSRPSTYKPFIKIWMVDRQSRSLVIEPKLLTNLRPDALGDLQGTTELDVPRDCLDVQIAAIAIDMATQQESGKAVVNRHVVPASQTSWRSGLRR